MTQLTPRPTPLPDRATTPSLPRTDPVTSLPILILYPHSRCNCRCTMCDIWKTTTREEIRVEDVARWIDEWRTLGVERVVLSGGEALMHSRLWELCALLRGAGIGVTILSTGLLLRRHADAVVRWCDDLVVSLDGPAEVHDAVRGIPGAFEKLAAGVRAVREADLRNEIRISGRCVVQRANHRRIHETVQVARDVGLDRISFLAPDVTSDAFNRPEPWSQERMDGIALSREEIPELAREIERLERDNAGDFATGFIAESPTKLRRRLLQYFSALRGENDFAPVECNAPWVSSVIETDGTVRPCFFQPALGNIHQAGGLAAILNSAEALRWRGGLDTTRDEICRRCVCSLALRATDTPADTV